MAEIKKKKRRKITYVRPRKNKGLGRPPRRHYSSNFEKTTASALIKKGIPFSYEETAVDYVQTRTYWPDFELNKKFFVETKGRFTSTDRSKHLLIQKQHPELDIRFVFMLDNKLNPKSKKRYSDWCKHYGFKYAIGEIPQEWIDEAMQDEE